MVSYGDPRLALAGFCADREAFGQRQETRFASLPDYKRAIVALHAVLLGIGPRRQGGARTAYEIQAVSTGSSTVLT